MNLLQGDALEVLRTLPDGAANCCVTSPPYWGLRDYGVEGQIGLEATPELYVARLVEVFREVRRVLRDDGTLWLNLGDSYAGSWGAQSRGDDYAGSLKGGSMLSARQIEAHPKTTLTGSLKRTPGMKPKDLCGIPWSVAFALRADGWYLRSDIIWHKPNPMPESVTDRPTKAHEYLFLLSKNERYYYDAAAIAEPMAEASTARYEYGFGGAKTVALIEANKDGIGQRTRVLGTRDPGTGRNRRSVWTIPTQPYPEAHFATFPEDLVKPCILAGCPTGGVVLDPFLGSGTTAKVAQDLHCHCIGIELNPTYLQLAQAVLPLMASLP